MDKTSFFKQLYADKLDDEENEAEIILASPQTREQPKGDTAPPGLAQTCFTALPRVLENQVPSLAQATIESLDHDDKVETSPNLVSIIRSTSPSQKDLPASLKSLPYTFDKPARSLQDTMAASEKRKLPWVISDPREIHQTKSRKKTQTKPEPAESEPLFKGMVFYYFPNSDVHPARKFRIKKAAERGCVRAHVYDARATHIIVDNGRTYQELIEYLKVPNLRDTVLVVNDFYPAECIEFGRIIDPLQSRFRISGLPISLQKKPLTTIGPEKNVAQVETYSSVEEAYLESKPHTVGLSQPESAPSELDETVEEVRHYSKLPIQLEESSDAFTEDELASRVKQSQADRKQHSTFQCMRAHNDTGSIDNPNARTIQILLQMTEYYERTDDHWRKLSYQKAISALRRQTTKIETKEQAQSIRAIGARLAEKIEEIVQTDRLRRLEYAQAEPQDMALQLFTGVYGAGPKQAQAWIAQGHRTLNDLLNRASLTPTQRIGVERYSDFAERIPCSEVEKHLAFVQAVLVTLDARARVVVGGSYRRGAASSGDVDFLIIGSDDMCNAELEGLIFNRLVPALFASGYLQCALAASTLSSLPISDSVGGPYDSSGSGNGSKWHGAARLPDEEQLPSPWRRVDFLKVPAAESGAAMLYFTGNALFNRSMRLLARRRGMRLNQRGLWQLSTKGPKALLESRNEKRIFDILGVPWREPHERNC